MKMIVLRLARAMHSKVSRASRPSVRPGLNGLWLLHILGKVVIPVNVEFGHSRLPIIYQSLVLICYSIFLLAFATSLEAQTTSNLTVYATSAFSAHSLVATVLVVQQVVNGRSYSSAYAVITV